MTTNKPEVVAYLHIDKENPECRGASLYHNESCANTLIHTEPLIRLSDYEALQAEYESLRKASEQQPVPNPVGEMRLWDTQWSNIVNAPEVLNAESQEDAVIVAVKMAERVIAKNAASQNLPPAVQGEPVAWSLRFRHGDKYERVGPVNYRTTFGSKKDADIYADRVARDLYGNPELERRPVVVPLYVAQPAEQQPALTKYQPCGCVICTCEHETQCQGCGAKHCGTHPIGQLYQQPTPDVSALVEALQAISRNELDAQRAQRIAAEAFATHRKQGVKP